MNSPSQTKRRGLAIDRFEDVMPEIRQLAAGGYRQNGHWTLGQICRHLSISLDLCMDGYPGWMSLFAPIRPVLRRWMLPRLLRHESPTGVRTASSLVPPNDVDDQTEIERLSQTLDRLRNHSGEFHPHPGFGRLDPATFERFHAAHAAHHLSFLEPESPKETA